ncbi:hypothetical protein ABPG75_005219 [Micractinium tetrahymenae]
MWVLLALACAFLVGENVMSTSAVTSRASPMERRVLQPGQLGGSADDAGGELPASSGQAAEFVPGEIPSWVDLGKQRPASQAHHERNLQDVARINEEGVQYDLLQYGDSLTALLRDYKAEVWDQVFPPDQILATPLGMGGSTLEELAARLVYGGEAPDIPPKVVVLLAGYNNARYVKRTDPAELMDWILQWLRYSWPDTHIALSALLPNAYIDLTSLNEKYAQLAEDRGALFFDCNERLDPASTSQFGDGTHWLPEGQRMWLECMREAVGPLLDGWEVPGSGGGSSGNGTAAAQ